MNGPTSIAAGPMAPALARLRDAPPSAALRGVLWALLALVGTALAWSVLGRLDIVASAGGKLVPGGYLKIVQPAEPGVIDEILVADGARVQAGDLLMRMNATVAGADHRSIVAELGRRRLELRRIDAELVGAAWTTSAGDAAGFDAAQLAAVRAQHEANRRALADALEQERATLQRTRAELAGATEQRDKLLKVLPMYREQETAYRDLFRQGFAGRLMQLDKERELIEKERDLAAAGHAIAAAQATIAQSERRTAQIESGWRQRLQAERIEALGQVARLEQELAKSDHRGRQLELRAPHDGVVQDLATHTRGTVVQPGTVLMSLVPDTEPLLAEVWLRNADIGFVAPGQPVRLKLAAYAFQKYGLLEGRIAQVSADASDPQARSGAGAPAAARDAAAAAAADSGPVFKVQVALDTQQLLGRGEPMRLAPGMAVTAEIHQGTRSVLEYLLSPIQRVAQEAGRER